MSWTREREVSVHINGIFFNTFEKEQIFFSPHGRCLLLSLSYFALNRLIEQWSGRVGPRFIRSGSFFSQLWICVRLCAFVCNRVRISASLRSFQSLTFGRFHLRFWFGINWTFNLSSLRSSYYIFLPVAVLSSGSSVVCCDAVVCCHYHRGCHRYMFGMCGSSYRARTSTTLHTHAHAHTHTIHTNFPVLIWFPHLNTFRLSFAQMALCGHTSSYFCYFFGPSLCDCISSKNNNNFLIRTKQLTHNRNKWARGIEREAKERDMVMTVIDWINDAHDRHLGRFTLFTHSK